MHAPTKMLIDGIPTVELTAGTHILKMTYDPNCTKTMHFRNIYLAKVS